MAYADDNWNPVGGQSRRGSNSQVILYNNVDNDTVTDADYFNDAFTRLTVNDVIYSIGGYTAGVASTKTDFIVTAIAAGVVTIAAL